MSVFAKKFAVVAAGLVLMAFTEPKQDINPDFLSADEVIQYLDNKSELVVLLLHSYAQGMEWSNTELESQGKAPLYCAPSKLAINGEQHADIFRKHVKDNPYVGKYPAAMVLLDALQATFPCD
jgi:hypothetical protein